MFICLSFSANHICMSCNSIATCIRGAQRPTSLHQLLLCLTIFFSYLLKDATQRRSTMQDVSGEFTEELAESIDSWRHSVPSRMEREDPFTDDGFMARPSTRVVSKTKTLSSSQCADLDQDIPRARTPNAPPFHIRSPRLHPRRHPHPHLPQAAMHFHRPPGTVD